MVTILATLIVACMVNTAMSSMIVIPSYSTQNQTQPVSIPITLNNLSYSDIISIELNIDYDPNVLSANDVSLTGSILENQNYLFDYNVSIPGIIFAIFASYDSVYTGTGFLLNLEFNAIGAFGDSTGITISKALINDQTCSTSNGIFTVAPNSNPTITNISSQTVDEDNALSVTITLNDYETNPCDLTLTLASSDETIISANNISYICISGNYYLSITPSTNQSGNVTITITAEDSGNLSSTAFLDLTITAVNDMPEIGLIPDQSTDEDIMAGPISFSVTDTDGDALTLSGMSSNLTLVSIENISFSGTTSLRSLTITPSTNVSGMAMITISVTDGSYTVNTSFALTVNAVNDAPVISSISGQTINEDTSINDITFTSTDFESGACELTVTVASSDPTLVTDITSQCYNDMYTLTAIPILNQNGIATITVTVTDNLGASASSSFDLTVIAINDPPVLTNPISNRIATEGINYSFTFNSNTFTDPDLGDILTYTATQSNGSELPSWLSFNSATRSFFGLPDNSDVGMITITITAIDSSGQSITDTFELNVINTNSTPFLANPISDQSTMEDTPYSFTFAANTFSDADIVFGDTLSYSAILADGSMLPSWLTFDSNTRHFSGTPLNADVGMITITIIASDTLNESATESFYLSVINTNDAPEITDIFSGQLNITSSGLTIDEDTSVDTISYTISDSDDTNLTVTISSSDITLLPNSSISYECNADNCDMALTPSANQNGSSIITVTVTDPSGLTASKIFELIVSSVNDAPIVSSIPNTSTLKNTASVPVSFTATDVEDAPCDLTITTVSSNTNVVINDNISYGCQAGNYTISVTPETAQHGMSTITVMISDSEGLTTSTDFTVSVNNQAPIAGNGEAYTIKTSDEDTSFTIIAGYDPDGDSLTITTISPPTNGMISFDNALTMITYTPTANYYGTDQFIYQISDGADTDTYTISVIINSINDIPEISMITTQNLNEGTSLNITMTATDIESSSLTVIGISSDQSLIPDSNITIINEGNMYTITLTPVEAQAGFATITVMVDDGTIITAQTIVVTVNEVYYTIAGHVSSYTDIAGSHVMGVSMTLSGTHTYNMMTDSNGLYTFTSVRPGDYTLTAFKSDDINSLSLSDAIKILSSTVRNITLTCHEKIAADANMRGFVSAMDAAKVALYNAGVENCVNDECVFWRFIPEAIINCETWPLIEFESARRYTDLNGDALNQDFIGIQCGNVAD